jgi:hypothetical protein
MINSSNDRLDMLINNLYTPFYLTHGNYDANSFANEMTAIMGEGWGITLDTITNTFTVSYTSPFTILSTSTMAKIIGLLGSDVVANIGIGGKYYASLKGACNFLQLPRIFMRCRDLANSVLVGSTPQNTSNDVLVALPNSAPVGGKIIYENISQIKTEMEVERIKEFVINITDDAGNLVDFKGCTSYFGFAFDIYRKPPTLQKMTWKQLVRQILSDD